MKLILSTILTLFVAVMAMIATPAAAETANFDGCVGVKVEGTNYFNLVDPRCKTVSSQYSSSPGEDKRRELAEAAEAADS